MDFARQILSVLLVLGLLAGALWWLRRTTGQRIGWPSARKRAARRLESVERLALTPQHALHLVRIGDRGLLVAVHAGGCSLIDSRPWRDWEATAQDPGQRAAQYGAAQ